jgi:hemerythrin
MPSIEEHRQRHDLAVQRMEELAHQLDHLPDNTEPEVVEELSRRFDESKNEAREGEGGLGAR